MTLRIECPKFPQWDGAEVASDASRDILCVTSIRGTTDPDGTVHPPGTPGLVRLAECRGTVGVAEDEAASLYCWQPVLRRWMPLEQGPVARLRRLLTSYRTIHPSRAFWIKPSAPEAL